MTAIGCHRTYNRYNDVELDLFPLNTAASPSSSLKTSDFISFLRREEDAWKIRMSSFTRERDKYDAAIMWVKLPRHFFSVFGDLMASSEFKFTLHHATNDYIMLARRRGDALSSAVTNAPPYGTHYIKVECLVVELGIKPRYLMVREKYASGADRSHFYKLVTGALALGERIDEACVREVLEETGVRACFVGLIGVVQRTNTRFCRDEMIYGCVLHAQPGQKPKPDRRELLEAFWEEIDPALLHCNQPAYRWIKAAGRAKTENLLTRSDHADLRGGGHYVSCYYISEKSR